MDKLTSDQRLDEAENKFRFKMLSANLKEFSRSNFHPGGGQQYQNHRNNFQNRRNGNGQGGQDNRSGRPRGKIHRKEFDVPNTEQWKEFIKKGWCPLHGFRGGRTHTLENCRDIKHLVEAGKIAINDENEITTGAGTRIALNSD